jgi:hypothetical protein
LHSILFSLILTPNVPTLFERCMIKHKATSPYAITHFTCDMGFIDHFALFNFLKACSKFLQHHVMCLLL